MKTDSDKTIRNQKIIDMWNEKQTSPEIAKAMGMTRSAVMGVVHRHGERKTISKTKASLPAPAPAPKPAKVQKPAPIKVAVPVPEKISPIKKQGKNIMDLGPFDCRWVFDDGSFCLEKKANKSYCTEHSKIVYVPVYKKNAPRQGRFLARRKS